MKSKPVIQRVLVLLYALFLFSCREELPQEIALVYEDLPDVVDFNYHVKPILADRCYHCHGPDNSTREAGLRLDTEEGAFAALESGERAIVSGSWSKSHALQRMLSEDPSEVMPPPESNLTLTPEEVATIAKWIDQGATYKKHWSFIPPEKQTPPEPKINAEFAQTPIDNFVLARLAREDMRPSPEADKERLLRRVTFDLTGLPPTIADMDAFLGDNSEDAYEKVVDRLMASDAYAERMAMEWMDVSRYADSHGMHADGSRLMWPWRDWVIKAFAQNMPYNQFVTWQLAGDLMPNATREQKLATAFHRNHAMTAEGGVVDEEFRLKYVFDRANTTSTAFLGLTLECAQCHDHKFDPISQKDFYSMSAFFNNVRELGMTGDDGNYGPMLLLPTEEQEEMMNALDAKEHEVNKKLEAQEKEVDQLKAYLASLSSDQKIALPKSEGYFAFDKITKGKDKKGKLVSRLDVNQKTWVSSEPQLVEGVKGKALSFDDGYEFVQLQEVGLFELSDPFSASVWVKPDEGGKIQTIMGTSGSKNTFWRGWEFYLDTMNRPSVKLIHSLPHNLVHVTATESVPTKNWTQLSFTYDGSGKADGVRVFVNGEKANTETEYDHLYKTIKPSKYGSDKPHNQSIRVAKAYRAFTGEFGIYKGAIDEIHVFHEELTALEVKQLYAKDKGEGLKPLNDFTPELQQEYALKRGNSSYQELREERAEVKLQRLALLDKMPEVMVMEEMTQPRPMHILARGEYDSPLEKVQPETPGSVLGFPDDLPRTRLGLATWLTDPKNPLMSRVTVNRYWQMIFGRGLVSTPDDFGLQGSLPSHPELLDWLAVDFIESGWDVMNLLKMMVMSSTYRQASIQNEEQVKSDPANILLARGSSSRLPAEMIRDNALAASGLLKHHVGGESVKPYQPEGLWIEKGNFSQDLLRYKADSGDSLYRRSLYTFVRRTSPHPAMVAFDAPNRDVCVMKRENTNTPLQALVLLNDQQFVEAARVMAQRIQQEGGERIEERIGFGFRLATGRKPLTKEVAVLQDMYNNVFSRFSNSPVQADSLLTVGDYPMDNSLDKVETATWTLLASTMLNHDEAYTKR